MMIKRILGVVGLVVGAFWLIDGVGAFIPGFTFIPPPYDWGLAWSPYTKIIIGLLFILVCSRWAFRGICR